MLDSLKNTPSTENIEKPQPLINNMQDHNPNFWSDVGSGLMAGASASLHNGKGQMIRDGSTIAVGLAAGYWGDVYSAFSGKAPLIFGTAVLATVISRHFEDKQQETGNYEYDLGKDLGRFATDVAVATGLGYFAGKQLWRREGDLHGEYLINKNSDARYVPAHNASYGPKQYSFGARYDHTGLTLGEKTTKLKDFLKDRGELSKFPDMLDRMKAVHDSSFEGRSWTTRY